MNVDIKVSELSSETVLFDMMYLTIILGLLAIGGSLAACPAKWLHHGSSCYFISTDELDWSTARDICQEFEGGYLCEIETKDESDYLETVTLPTHKGFWLGGKDEVEGHWKWMTSGKDFTYTDWSPNEPNDLNHNEDCLHLFQARSQHWNDIDCALKQNYICETRFNNAGPIPDSAGKKL
ncbi:C-type lectin superfamily 17 member A [Mytilus galloprovincialis]|uniref:C-type lectin superfamily 17 member A n=1 Tax=Mytilus galloprovincialis TaxID=29158 RepID=A0A8B6C182_MYTGA|nr:C-type lectin superfamily 17 member A [Mytilus galloprovincialis]